MDEARLAQGEKAYGAGDWRAAAREFLASVQGCDGAGTGHAFHMAGNALVKLRRNGDAATVYGHALKDDTYEKRANVLTNLGSALASDGRLSDAVAAYEGALAEQGNDSLWKAHQGKAGALFDMGRYEDAAQAYRDASWESGNPDPGRSLNNLGLCFLQLKRPEEAVDAFKAAVAMDSYTGKGRASANLGLAFASMGFFEEAVRALETARDMYSHDLSGAALSAYEAAKAASDRSAEDDMGGSDGDPVIPTPASDEEDADPAAGGSFFTMSEEEMRDRGRAALKAERRARLSGKALALRVGIAVLVAVGVFGGLAAAWATGLGYPSQGVTVSGLIDAYRSGADVAGYWVAVPSTDVKREMRMLPARFDSFKVDGIKAGATSSTARLTIVLDKNGSQSFTVSLVREGVGWKVNGVRNEWRSTAGGS